MTRQARNDLIVSLLADAPLLRLMVSLVLADEEEYARHAVGTVELHYAPGQVKSELRVSRGCRKVSRVS